MCQIRKNHIFFSYGSNQEDASGYQDAGKNRLEHGGTPMDRVFEENVIFDHFFMRKSEKNKYG